MRAAALVPLLAGTGAGLLLLALLLGPTPLAPSAILAALAGGGLEGDRIVLYEIRLPRALAAFAVGAALGLSGAALQGLLRNPLAEPGVLGVSAAAALAATATIAWGLAGLHPLVVPCAAIAGALAATAFLSLAAARSGGILTLILIGVGLSSLAGAGMSLLLNLAPNPFSLADLVAWMLGSVANRSLADLALALPFLAAGAALLLAQGRALSVLALGEEAAAGSGVALGPARLAVIAGAGLATGAAVSLAGAIGFVGIVAPHLVRSLVAHDPARVLVPAGLAGGALLVAADILIRLLPGDSELQLGVVAALIGGPAFIWIAARRGRHDA